MSQEVPRMQGTELFRIRESCVELSRQNAYAVGFIPRDAYLNAAVGGHLIRVEEGGELAGMILHSPLNAIVRVHQACVAKEIRRQELGSRMYLSLYTACLESNVERMVLHCAQDLEANQFWEAMGLQVVATREPGTATARVCNRWEVVFPAGEQLEAAVARVMQEPKVKRLAAFLGVEQALRKGLEKRHRRQLTPGARLRRKKGE